MLFYITFIEAYFSSIIVQPFYDFDHALHTKEFVQRSNLTFCHQRTSATTWMRISSCRESLRLWSTKPWGKQIEKSDFLRLLCYFSFRCYFLLSCFFFDTINFAVVRVFWRFAVIATWRKTFYFIFTAVSKMASLHDKLAGIS